MMRYEYPTPDETLALRDRLIETFGGVYSPAPPRLLADAEFLIQSYNRISQPRIRHI